MKRRNFCIISNNHFSNISYETQWSWNSKNIFGVDFFFISREHKLTIYSKILTLAIALIRLQLQKNEIFLIISPISMPALTNNQIFFCFCNSLNVIVGNKVLCIIKDNPETLLCLLYIFSFSQVSNNDENDPWECYKWND